MCLCIYRQKDLQYMHARVYSLHIQSVHTQVYAHVRSRASASCILHTNICKCVHTHGCTYKLSDTGFFLAVLYQSLNVPSDSESCKSS